jgi:hypothetical protein
VIIAVFEFAAGDDADEPAVVVENRKGTEFETFFASTV